MENFNSHNKNMLWAIIVFIVLIIIGVFGISQCSHSSNKTYEPIAEDGKGFIGKADALFSQLLSENTIDTINARSLNDLNRKYPAFVFDVPDSLNSDLNIQDIRLVGINENFIKESDRNFYESSDLRNLIKQQRLDKNKKLFHISITKDKGCLVISKIRMIKSLHKIKFSNDIWEGKLIGQSHNPINDSTARYLIYGSSVLPIRIQNEILRFGITDYPIYMIENEKNNNDWANQFDLYDHYNKHFANNKNCFKLMFDRENSNMFLGLQLLRDKVVFRSDASLKVICITKDSISELIFESNAKDKFKTVSFSPDCENIRIMIDAKDGDKWSKKAEFQIAQHNPLRDLAYTIYTNKGKTRKQIDPNYTDVFTQQIINTFLQNMSDSIVAAPISLSIDPFLSKAIEKELDKYGKSFIPSGGLAKNEHFEISMCLINSATGEILAAPYYNYTQKELTQERKIAKRNPNMIRRYIGSCFKPIMTLASLQLHPNLIGLETGGNSGITKEPTIRTDEKGNFLKDKKGKYIYDTEILGCPIKNTFASSTLSHYTSPRNLETYLASSNDVYPVVLAMYSLTDFENHNPLSTKNLKNYINQNVSNGKTSISFLNPKVNNTYNRNKEYYTIHQNSPFADILDELYDIKSEDIINTDDKNPTPAHYLLRDFLTDNDNIYFPEISPDYTYMSYYNWNDSINETFRGEVVPWVLGQGTNEWSPLKLAEAWARMVTKFPVMLSYIHNENPSDIYDGNILYKKTSNLLNDSSETRLPTWNTFLDKFKAAQSNTQVGSSNTLIAVHNTVQRINTIQHREGKDSLIVLGKTGTPDDFDRGDWEHFDISGKIMYDIGLYSFSLMTEGQYQQLKNNTENPSETISNAGITAVIRIVHSYPVNKPRRITNIGSNDARNFLSAERLQKILFYTDELFK